jgi:hypothetical protein
VEFLKSLITDGVTDDEEDVNLNDDELANEEAQLEAELEDEDFDEMGMGEDDDID